LTVGNLNNKPPNKVYKYCKIDEKYKEMRQELSNTKIVGAGLFKD